MTIRVSHHGHYSTTRSAVPQPTGNFSVVCRREFNNAATQQLSYATIITPNKAYCRSKADEIDYYFLLFLRDCKIMPDPEYPDGANSTFHTNINDRCALPIRHGADYIVYIMV